MTALSFPSNPTNGQLYTGPNGTVYAWDGEKWTVNSTAYTGTALTEITQDRVQSMFSHGENVGISFSYNDSTDKLIATVADDGPVDRLVNGVNEVVLGTDGSLTFPAGSSIDDRLTGVMITGAGLAAVNRFYPKVSNTLYQAVYEGVTYKLINQAGTWSLDVIGESNPKYTSVDLVTWTTGTGVAPAPTGEVSTRETTLTVGTNTWVFGNDGKLTAPGNLQVDGGRIILSPYGNAYIESVDYGVNSVNSAVNIFGGPHQKIKLRAGFGTEATWTFGADGKLAKLDGLTLTAGGQFNICTIVTGGSGYNTGSALKATTGGSGTGMTVAIGYGLSNQLSNVDVVNPGTGYSDGDVINVLEGTGGTFTITRYNNQGNQGNNNTVESNWTFGTDGKLYLPSIGSGGGAILRGPLNESIGISAYNDTGAGTTYTLDVAVTGQVNIPTGSTGLGRIQNPDGIEILTNIGETQKLWTFGSDGTTTFPNNSIKNSLGSNTAITTQQTLTANNSYINVTDFSTDVDLGGGLGVIAGWYQRNASQIEFALFGDSTFQSYLTGLALGRTVIVTYNTSGGTSTLTGTLTQAFSGTGQTDSNNPTWSRVSGRIDAILPAGQLGIVSINFPVYSTDTNDWTFGADGALTLPAGSYIDETAAPLGTAKSLDLHPGDPIYPTQYLRIYPTNGGDADHLHLTSGDLTATELFLGDDEQYVKLANTGNVEIRTGVFDYYNDTKGLWTFDSDGVLTLPTHNTTPGSRIKSAVDITIETGPYYLVDLVDVGMGSGGGIGTLDFMIFSTPNWETKVAVGDHVVSGTWTDIVTAVGPAGDVNRWTVTFASGDFTGNDGEWSFYKPGAAGGVWLFGVDGELTLPADAVVKTTSGNLTIKGQNYVLIDSAGDGQIEIGTSSGVGAVVLGSKSRGTNVVVDDLQVANGVYEYFSSLADATGVVTHNCANGHIFYHTSPDANWTVNLTNLLDTGNRATSVTLIITQGATGYYPSAVQIAGVAQTLNWQGNVTPTPSTNRTDVVTFSIINVSGTYTVLGQLTGF